MDPTDKLLAIEEIKQLKARYFRFVDSKQYDKMEMLFTPDVKVDHTQDHPSAKHDNRKDWIAMISGGMNMTVSVHHGHTPEIEITGPTTAKGIWPMQDWIWWPEGQTSPLGDRHIVGWGAYHETYEKTADGWRISSVTLKRVKIERT
jgi:hypothetical protein